MPATEPYTESDVIEAFAALTETVGAYLDILAESRPDENTRRQYLVAKAKVEKAHLRAADILAWITAEPDDEIDDAALDDALGADDDYDDLDEDDGDWEDDEDMEDDEDE